MFLKNRNISSKIKRSKVTDYAALMKILEIETAVIKPKHRNVRPSKMNKNFKKNFTRKVL